MKNLIIKIKELYQKYHGWYWSSIVGSLFMLIFSIVSFAYTKLNFHIILALFYLIIILIRTGNYLIRRHYKFDDLSNCSYINPLFTGFSMLLCQSGFLIVLVIVIKEKPLISFPFSWLIYGYALYAFWKMGMAIYGLVKGLRENNNCRLSLAAISMASGLYTMLILMVNLIGSFGTETITNAAMIGEYSMLGGSGVINLAFAIYLIVLGFRQKKAFKAS